jgi:hypothetical protein
VALLLALGASAGSLYLSLGLKLQACPLCFYQRSYALAAAAVLATGLAAGMGSSVPLSLLAFPISLAGLLVAGFHVWLELNGTLECPGGILANLGTAPKQSLAVFLCLTLVLLVDFVGWFRWLTHTQRLRAMRLAVAALVAVGLGVGLGLASIHSNPPLPAPPTKAWDGPPIVCRRPYVAP